MILIRKSGDIGLVLNGLTGSFTFESRDTSFVQIVRFIKQVMYDESRNWLKTLLLALNPLSQNTRIISDSTIDVYADFTDLSEEQRLVLRRAVSFENSPNERIVICQGFSGTGKSHVILAISLRFFQTGTVYICTAASNAAVNVYSDLPPSRPFYRSIYNRSTEMKVLGKKSAARSPRLADLLKTADLPILRGSETRRFYGGLRAFPPTPVISHSEIGRCERIREVIR